MSQETSAASGRFIVRTVPLLYGILAGALFGNLYVGLVAGTLVSIALDLTICDRSMCRPLLRRAGRAGCPLLALAAQALAGTIETIGLRPPRLLADARCAPPRA